MLDIIREILPEFCGFYFSSVQVYFPRKKSRLKVPESTLLLLNSNKPFDYLLFPHIDRICHRKDRKLFFPVQHAKKQFLGFYQKKNPRFFWDTIEQVSLFPLIDTRFDFKTDFHSFLSDEETKQESIRSILKALESKQHPVLYSEEFPEKISSFPFILQSLLQEKEKLLVLQINLSYDLLSENGIKAHIYPGRPFYIRRENSRSHIAQLLLRESITGFTLSPGHLFAYGLFSEDIKNGVSRHFFFYKMNRLANALYREKFCNVSDKCLESSYEELFADYIYFAKKNAYIE
ncbi:MAG: hypothetical protein KDK45_13695 [Leptospiraceae bacterium]|nr:hypothetical protein [Leptospiraceae bacterium]